MGYKKFILAKGPSQNVMQLESAYHKAKSRGKVGLKKVSIPIKITNHIRTELLMLGYTRDEMKHLTPKECWKIINKGISKKL